MISIFTLICFIALLIWLWCYVTDFSPNDYKKRLSDEVAGYLEWDRKFVWLDFKSFKPIFEISSESWGRDGCYIKNLKVVDKDTGCECLVAFKKRKDYLKAIALFNEYQKEKKKRIVSKKEIEDFDFFKKTIQHEIDRKKKEAEKEIEEANRFLNSLNER